MTEPITYYAIERAENERGPWVEVMRYATEPEARMNQTDVARHPGNQVIRVVRVTKEVV